MILSLKVFLPSQLILMADFSISNKHVLVGNPNLEVLISLTLYIVSLPLASRIAVQSKFFFSEYVILLLKILLSSLFFPKCLILSFEVNLLSFPLLKEPP
jgi:hypothetical protein